MDLDQLGRRNAEAAYERRRRKLRQRARLGVLQLMGTAGRTPEALPGEFGRLLVIRPDHLGDLLFVTPALHALRTALPGATITALVGPWGAPVFDSNPDIDGLTTLPFPGFARDTDTGFSPAAYRLLYEQAELLRGRFDAALVLRWDHWWGAWLAQVAGIPVRIGYRIPETQPFLTSARPYPPGRHEVLQNLDLAYALLRLAGDTPVPEVLPPGFQPDLALRFAPGSGTPAPAAGARAETTQTRAEIAIHPGAGAAVKLWRPEGWARVANTLAAEFGATVVLTGSAAEGDLCAQVAAGCTAGVTNLAGTTDLAALAGVYARCGLVLGPDCGPLHLAVAVGTPTVHLYGPADPVAFGPWGPASRHRVVTLGLGCAPCGVLDWDDEIDLHPCVREIPIERVLAAARAAIAAP